MIACCVALFIVLFATRPHPPSPSPEEREWHCITTPNFLFYHINSISLLIIIETQQLNIESSIGKGCVLVAFPKGEGRDGAAPYAASDSSIFSVSELISLLISSFLLINLTANTTTPVAKTPPPRYKNAVE